MSSYIAEAVSQDSNMQPPREGQLLALTVDATGRGYDLSVLTINSQKFQANVDEAVFLTLRNDSTTTNLYYKFALTQGAAAALDPAVTLAAGSPLAFTTTSCEFIPPSSAINHRIHRPTDKFLGVRTSSGTTVLRLYPSSESTPQGQ